MTRTDGVWGVLYVWEVFPEETLAFFDRTGPCANPLDTVLHLDKGIVGFQKPSGDRCVCTKGAACDTKPGAGCCSGTPVGFSRDVVGILVDS